MQQHVFEVFATTRVRRESVILAQVIWQDRVTRILCLILLFCSLILVGLHFVGLVNAGQNRIGGFVWNAFNLTDEANFSANFGYGLLFLAAAAFLVIALQSGSRLSLFFSTVAGFLWMDDSMEYHEKMGDHLVGWLGLQAMMGLRAQDIGELLAWAGAGLVLFTLLLLALRQMRDGDVGLLFLGLGLFALLAIVGVLADMLHIAFASEMGQLLAVVEDGGELFAMALIACFAVGLLRKAEVYFG
ncbi:MAG: hypothetical protein ACU0DK_11605 [Pseudooceanicola sp.]